MTLRDHIRQKRDSKWAETFRKVLPEFTRRSADNHVSLQDFIPAVSPDLISPKHLAPITDAFEAIARGGIIELAFSVPPRHFKTTTVEHGLVWLVKERKRTGGKPLRIAYLTYSEKRAEEASRETMRIADRAGLGRGARWTFGEWETADGSVFRFTSLLAGVTGSGFDVVVVDDPYRRRQDADSAGIRKRIEESWAADVYTRQETGGTSFIVVHTRWHPHDLIGRITDPDYREGKPFAYVNLPAHNDNGEALCPEFWPLERLANIRATVTEFEWWALYMGAPRPRGATLFELATLTDTLPTSGRFGIGVDLAYSQKTYADFSVALVLCRHPGNGLPVATIVDVVRRQVQSTEFAFALKSVQAQYPGAPMRWYGSGTEEGARTFMRAEGVHALDMRAPKADKYNRALGVAAAWNAGRILVPRHAPWAEVLTDEVQSFTGLNDPHDDIVDALAAAWDAIDVGEGKVETVPDAERRAVRRLRSAY